MLTERRFTMAATTIEAGEGLRIGLVLKRSELTLKPIANATATEFAPEAELTIIQTKNARRSGTVPGFLKIAIDDAWPAGSILLIGAVMVDRSQLEIGNDSKLSITMPVCAVDVESLR